jgi:cell division protein FtsQ
MVAQKRLRRHPETRSTFLKILVLVSLILLAAGATVFALAFYTDICSIKNVVVKGSKNLDASYVRRESGVDSYKNLITLPVGKIETNLKQDPWIENVKISRKLLHTVTIEIRERQPIGVIDFDGAGFLVDGYGWVIKKVDPAEYKSIARIHGGDTSVPDVGCEVRNGKIRECTTTMRKMPVELRESITLANPFDAMGLVFVCRLGFKIIYGPAADTAKKNEVMEAIMLDIKSNHRRVAYLDLRVPDSPVVKPD